MGCLSFRDISLLGLDLRFGEERKSKSEAGRTRGRGMPATPVRFSFLNFCLHLRNETYVHQFQIGYLGHKC